jgi:hypothetical protein
MTTQNTLSDKQPVDIECTIERSRENGITSYSGKIETNVSENGLYIRTKIRQAIIGRRIRTMIIEEESGDIVVPQIRTSVYDEDPIQVAKQRTREEYENLDEYAEEIN